MRLIESREVDCMLKQRESIRWIVVATSLLTLAALPWASPIVLKPESKLWLIGDSSLHAYSSTATEVNLTMDVKTEGDSTPKALYESIRSGNMKALEVRIPVRGLKSGKAKLDQNLYKALKAEPYPDILFHLSSYEVSPSTSTESFLLIAKGDLAVAGRTKSIDLRAKATAGETVRIEGSEEVLMTDYGIKPPSVMGVIRTHNRVVVNFDLFLHKK